MPRFPLLSDRKGSFAPIVAILLIPLVAAVGLSVDYGNGYRTRSEMQDALDAATVATALTRQMTSGQRTQHFQDLYASNGGLGTPTLLEAIFSPDGSARVRSSAAYAMPTRFMQVLLQPSMNIEVQTDVGKAPGLVSAKFELDSVSGWWDKTLTLYAPNPPMPPNKPIALMSIAYKWNGVQGGKNNKGWGTTIVSQYNASTKKMDEVMRQSCTGNEPTTCKKTFTDPKQTAANVDVSAYSNIYLQMDISTTSKLANPGKGVATTLRSDDPSTSDHLFLGGDYDSGTIKKAGKQVASGTSVNLFDPKIVPCGVTSGQSWEDGGTQKGKYTDPDTDFRYKVTGKCDTTNDPTTIAITR